MTKIAENDGCLYQLSDANYRRLLTFVVAGKEYDLCELGAHIGCVHVRMVNFGKGDAEFELSRLQNEPGSRSRSGTPAGLRSKFRRRSHPEGAS